MRRSTTALLLLCGCAAPGPDAPVPAVPQDPGSASAGAFAPDIALQRLPELRARVATADLPAATRAWRLIDLGGWAEAERILEATSPTPATRLAAAHLALKRHRYGDARALVDGVLAAAPTHPLARLLDARLAVDAWRLDDAERIARALDDEIAAHAARAANRRSAANPLAPAPALAPALLLARIALLRQDFDAAERIARAVLARDESSARAHLLLADVAFWRMDPAGAEAPLRRALELDPYDADARFAYGYAIWRRVDATQLDAMAAHWDVALAVEPLHYLTHWHWGNGHTNLTYADYAQPEDSLVDARLARADTLAAAGRIEAALAHARDVAAGHPESLLPALTRASLFYMAYPLPRALRLDSAETIFRRILERKPHYGPAHNGLAAVIKQRQFGVLAAYDSLEAVIAATPRPSDPAFQAVFDDVAAYPGDRVAKMVWRQLGPGRAYVPLLRRLGETFTIPPLHVDLAEAMDAPYFRSATTFDNRQWMDIRGVGGGATGIEYVERGAHWERNVTAHEYVHLFHGNVMTDAEVRRIRALYHDAVANGRALDYYAANNESEYFAQGYEAWLSDRKVHPLNHKSMNTRDDLARKDPPLLEFIEALVARQRASLGGDTAVFASNWAQVYVALAERAQAEADAEAEAQA
ncbi:MAG: hypothetical protein ACRELV_00625, partial [Longimicrobiales bacterium]